jgi:hypothetical protein
MGKLDGVKGMEGKVGSCPMAATGTFVVMVGVVMGEGGGGGGKEVWGLRVIGRGRAVKEG